MKQVRKHLRYDEKYQRWIVDYRVKGERFRKFFRSRNAAEDYLRADVFLVAIGYKMAPTMAAEDTKSSVAVSEAVRWYSSTVSATKSPFSAKWEPRKLKEWQDRHRGKELHEIGLRELLQDRSDLIREKGYLPQTANRWLTLIKSFFKACQQAKFIKSNPALDIKKLPVPESPHVDVISEKDQVRLLKAAKPWVRYPLWLAMKTGMRRGEIVNLRWSAINLGKSNGGFLIIEASEGFHTKSKRSRRLPLTSEMVVIFVNLLKQAKERGKAGPNDFIFVTSTGRRILPDCLTREAKKVMKRVLGRENGAVHIWRHSALTLMLQKGADIETVRRVAGHSSLTVTQRYCHSNDVAMQGAIDTLRSSVQFGKNWAILGSGVN